MDTTRHIGQIIHHARVFNLATARGITMDTDALLQTVDRLFTVLDERQVTYVLVGGIAILSYIPGRNTEDIDLIFSVPALRQVPEIILSSQDTNFARGTFETLQIDLLLTRNPFFAMIQQHYATIRAFRERALPCATVEGLLLLKLYALPSLYRQGDFVRVGLYENDIATLMQAYQPALDALLAVLARYVSTTDLVALEEIVGDIRQRLARFQHRVDPQA
jgi:hypothetical protein